MLYTQACHHIMRPYLTQLKAHLFGRRAHSLPIMAPFRRVSQSACILSHARTHTHTHTHTRYNETERQRGRHRKRRRRERLKERQRAYMIMCVVLCMKKSFTNCCI